MTSPRDDTPARSSPYATATGMEDNAIDHDPTSALTAPQQVPSVRSIAADAGDSQESRGSANLAPQTTSSDNSQATDGHDTISTPQTSSSDGPSSQGTSQDASISQLSQLSQAATVQDHVLENHAPRTVLTVPSTAGQKRTADGQVKPPSPPNPNGPRNRGHSRTTSAVSNVSSATSRIGEVRHSISSSWICALLTSSQLSSELRTRLSYAMVKVNNGWQSNTIDEVESLASLTGSPASSTSTLHGRLNVTASPRATMIAMQRQSNNSAPNPLGADFDLFSRTESASRTYESFWREHPTTGPSNRQNAVSPPIPKASLAPPADIRPSTSSRRSHAPKFSKPPSIPTHSSNPTSTSTPRTPTQSDMRDKRVHTTPSQKTIQEQDAIETLLFMSSPGNSGHHAPFGTAPRPSNPLLGSPQRSPLRAEFRVQDPRRGRRVGFEKLEYATGGGDAGTRLDESKERVIDRLLDRVSDTTSSSEEDVEVPLGYESRAVGRV